MKKQAEPKKELAALTKRFEETCSLPHDIISNMPVIHMYGNCHIRIENFRCILEYHEDCIKLQCHECVIVILGKHFLISFYDKNELRMKGYIQHVDFL